MGEKGVSDLAAHHLQNAGISVIRRVKKMDMLRISKASGGLIVSSPEYIHPKDLGNSAGLFEVCRIGDNIFTFIVECLHPASLSILVRGASRDLLNQAESCTIRALNMANTLSKVP